MQKLYFWITSSCSEERATNITVYFPTLQGKFPPQRIRKFFIPDGVNGGGFFGTYDPTMDKPFTTIAPNNIALLKLPNNVPNTLSKYIYFL